MSSPEPPTNDSFELDSSYEKILKYMFGLLYQVLIVFVFWAHSQASFSDPGVVEVNVTFDIIV
jgi:hypothetical protein